MRAGEVALDMCMHVHTCVQAKVRFTGFEASWDTTIPHGSDEMFPARPLHAHSLAVLFGLLVPLRHLCPMPF